MNTYVTQITFDENFAASFDKCIVTQTAAGRCLVSTFMPPGTMEVVLLFVEAPLPKPATL